jgi:hypothetical protein
VLKTLQQKEITLGVWSSLSSLVFISQINQQVPEEFDVELHKQVLKNLLTMELKAEDLKNLEHASRAFLARELHELASDEDNVKIAKLVLLLLNKYFKSISFVSFSKYLGNLNWCIKGS